MVLQLERTILLQRITKMSSRPRREEEDQGPNPKEFQKESPENELQNSGASVIQPVVVSAEYPHGSTILASYSGVLSSSGLPIEPYAIRPFSYFDDYRRMYVAQTYQTCLVPMPSPPAAESLPFGDVASLDESDLSDVSDSPAGLGCLKLLERAKCDRRCQWSSLKRDMWVFKFPNELCGRLIGKGGHSIQLIMQETGTYLALSSDKEDPTKQLLKVCGMESQILHAVNIIESKFASECKAGDVRSLPLIKSENSMVVRQQQIPTDKETKVMIASIINAGHLYLTKPQTTKVDFKANFEKEMEKCYNSGHIPKLDRLPSPGTYCVSKMEEKWFRIQVISFFAQAKKVEAILVDYGAYVMLPSTSLWKIRADFLEVPFQAIECCLANIIPRNGDFFFTLFVTNLLQKLTDKRSLKAITRAEKNGIPYIELFVQENNKLTSVNRRLVACGAAQWVDALIGGEWM